MKKKVCKKCGQEKPLSEFVKNKNCKDGRENQCKSCMKEYLKEYNKKYLEENREKKKEYMKEWYQENKEKKKEYYQENKEKIKEYHKEYDKKRYKTDTLYRLKICIRSMVKRAIKTKRTEEIIGCSYKHLKLHFEQQFTQGMSWENYGEWHIDHIRPLSWFDLTDPYEVAKANHYSNLQPMWAEQNLSKGNRFCS